MSVSRRLVNWVVLPRVPLEWSLMVAVGVGVGALGCASLGGGAAHSEVVQAALVGDLTRLQESVDKVTRAPAEISSSSTTRTLLTNTETIALARAVLRRELVAIDSGREFERFEQLEPCVASLQHQLVGWASGQGDVASASLWLLARSDSPVPQELRTGGASAERASRIAQGQESQRRRGLVEVIVGALGQASSGDTGTESPVVVSALLEAAKLDPAVRNRWLAIAALGVVGGEQANFGLADLWQSADGRDQEAILQAWATPGSYATGGEELLVGVAEAALSRSSITAALALQQRSGGPGGLVTSTLRAALRNEERSLQRLALLRAELKGAAELLPAVQRLTADQSEPLAALALYRLAQIRPLQEAQRERIESLRQSDNSETAHWARLVSPRVSNTVAVPTPVDVFEAELYRESLTGETAERRARAAQALLSSRGPAMVARALADDSPRVRTQLACLILAN